MAVTKIVARHYRVDVGINYILNGDKTENMLLTAFQYCSAENAYTAMMETKQETDKTDGVQCYHIIQAFKPGEIEPELALSIAQEFVREHLPGYEAVIAVHDDKDHIHAHILFNSVNRETGKKYHSNARSYYEQIRGISDRLCREHGLSVILSGERSHAIRYYEWQREKRGLPTYRSMLQADMRQAIEDANDFGHFLVLMENMGCEAKFGSRLSFRLRGEAEWIVPGRSDPLFTEDGIRAAIQGNLEAIEAGQRPAMVYRPPYVPYRKHPKYTGFLALYVHYLYLLGKIEKRQYPPRMTTHLKQEVMRFEQYKTQFAFLREHDISTPEQLAAYQTDAEERIAKLTKQRTILNVQKKKRKTLYDALADAEALRPASVLYAQGMTGIEDELARYMAAVKMLEQAGTAPERLAQEKVEVYEAVANINRDIRAAQKEITLCKAINGATPNMDKDIRYVETIKSKEEKQADKER